MRVLAAMSGGVDSAVAAALLKEQGHDVVGVTMLFRDEEVGRIRPDGRGCCGSQGARDARKVAARLGIAHYAWDFRREFEELVIENFCREYSRGRTPNPCIRCNERIKFRVLLDRARQLEADVIATGHHAQVARLADGFWGLYRGLDGRKDQSYFLYTMTQGQLSKVMMPVGAMTKAAVRDAARELGLPVADKPESQEICFTPDDDYASFVRERRPEAFRPGPVVDTTGKVLGEHQGVGHYTVGQRKGLGLAFGERRYVVSVDAETNTVVLGRREQACSRAVVAASVNWIAGEPASGPTKVLAKVRYQSKGGPAIVEPLAGGRARVIFEEPQWAPTPGQAVVFWQDECVLGGGTIETVVRE